MQSSLLQQIQNCVSASDEPLTAYFPGMLAPATFGAPGVSTEPEALALDQLRRITSLGVSSSVSESRLPSARRS
jgi:hypothetical protein